MIPPDFRASLTVLLHHMRQLMRQQPFSFHAIWSILAASNINIPSPGKCLGLNGTAQSIRMGIRMNCHPAEIRAKLGLEFGL